MAANGAATIRRLFTVTDAHLQIPGYALWPDGGLCDTTFFYRTLPPKR